MQRIIVLGNGTVPYKVCSGLRGLDSAVDILWMDFFPREKYPWFISSQLLQAGTDPADWSRQRAAGVVQFSRRAEHLGVQTDSAVRMNINPADREFTVLTNSGETTYIYDAVLLFPPLVPGTEHNPGYSFPSGQCMQKIFDLRQNPEPISVYGDDPLLLQCCMHMGKDLTWVRPKEAVWDAEIMDCLQEMVCSRGGNVVREEDTGSLPDKTAIYPSELIADQNWLQSLGLDESDTHKGGISLLKPGQDMRPGCFHLQDWISAGRELGENALRHGRTYVNEVLPGPEGARVGKKEIFRAGPGESGLKDGPDLHRAVCSNRKSSGESGEYVLKIWGGKKSGQLRGVQLWGRQASQWGNIVYLAIKTGKTAKDILGDTLVWPDRSRHPVHLAASIIVNKIESSGILDITPSELIASVEDDAEFFLLDVREKKEYARGKLSGAYNIPLTELKKRFNEIPRFTPLVLYSRISGKAFEAARYLRSKGAKQLYVLDGGYELWPFEFGKQGAKDNGQTGSTSRN
jgi:rhodanese-related sulfurtransferase